MIPSEPLTVKPPRPWWRDPMALLFGFFILLACTVVLVQGWILPQKQVDPNKPAPLPGGASFCDTPAPTKSTLEKPKPLGKSAD